MRRLEDYEIKEMVFENPGLELFPDCDGTGFIKPDEQIWQEFLDYVSGERYGEPDYTDDDLFDETKALFYNDWLRFLDDCPVAMCERCKGCVVVDWIGRIIPA